MSDEHVKLQVGDRIRLEVHHFFGCAEMLDYTIEEFRQCLGIFMSEAAREAGDFTPLCAMYGEGPDSKKSYISNYGEYTTNQVPLWMNLPRDSAPGSMNGSEKG